MNRTWTAMASAFFICGMATAWSPSAFGASSLDLAGRSLSDYPHFEFVRTFNAVEAVQLGVDPSASPGLVGATCSVYVVSARTAGEWMSDPTLTDVRPGGAQTVAFVPGGIVTNTVTIAAPGELNADAGAGFGVEYDVVIDVDGDGQLSEVDYIDGIGDTVGFYMVGDTTARGPLATTIVAHEASGIESGLVDQRIFYPSNTASLGMVPLVVISHGDGQKYYWYDYLQEHLASYGYVVMSHENGIGPGINAASLDTLQHTDAFLDQLGSIAGGALAGHIDSTRIVWIGHSRGGEGVVRAFDRLVDDDWSDTDWRPTHFDQEDIALISSIAPTDYLGPQGSNPHGVNYHLLYGAADGDVSGKPDNPIVNPFSIYERAEGNRSCTYVHGADHNDFNSDGWNDFKGPSGTEIGRMEAQQVAKGIYLPLLKHYTEGNLAARDFLWRQYEVFRPAGVHPATVVVNEFKEAPGLRKLVIDDYQDQAGVASLSSSLGAVRYSVTGLQESLLKDENQSFVVLDPMNGMTRAGAEDSTWGSVFEWDADAYVEFDVVAAGRDFRAFEWLSLRACQITNHPNTNAVLEDLTFSVTLVDGNGGASSIAIDSYGGGIEEPYQREGGWANEFETIRVRLDDFLRDGRTLDASNVMTIRLEFGPSFGSPVGAIGLDDVELVKSDNPTGTIVITQTDGDTVVTEGGETDSYSVALTQAPAASVAVTLATDGESTTAPTSLVFTSDNWNTPQSVTVTATDDLIAERPGLQAFHDGSISHVTTSTDPHWSNLYRVLAIKVIDNDNSIPEIDAGQDRIVQITSGNPWTPAQLTSVAWYDASDLSTISASNGKVSEWRDKSGNGRHASQSDSARRPTLTSSDMLVGGMPTISVPTGSEMIGLTTAEMTAKSIYAVIYYKDGTDPAFDDYSILLSGSGNDGRYVFGYRTRDFFQFPNSENFFNDGGTFKNGSSVSSISNVLPMPPSLFVFKHTIPCTQAYTLGFAPAYPDFGWQGTFCEFIFTDGSEDVATQQTIEGYLAHKWGVSNRLVADHPYIAAPLGGDAVTIALNGSVVDDDGDDLEVMWRKVTGTGPVYFENPAALDGNVTFTKTGTYVLRLTVDDGFTQCFDELTITVVGPSRVVTLGVSEADSELNLEEANEIGTVIKNGDGQWSVLTPISAGGVGALLLEFVVGSSG